jgi:hypothetical protein
MSPRPARRPRAAAAADQATHDLSLPLPVLGEVKLPSVQTIAFTAGLLTLAALEVIDWPVALLVGAGHLLSHVTQSSALREFGEALEEA